MNRICPPEEILSAYLSNTLPYAEKDKIEKHLAGCSECRTLLSDSHKILNSTDIKRALKQLLYFTKRNIFLFISLFSIILSFLIPKYFLQFLVSSIISGSKWIVDFKTTKTLIMVHEAWKRNGDVGAVREPPLQKNIAIFKKHTK